MSYERGPGHRPLHDNRFERVSANSAVHRMEKARSPQPAY